MKNLKTMLILFSAALSTQASDAQNVFTNKDGVANNGYDVVNYFTANAAERGNKDHSVTHNGATYYFKNAGHLQMFKENPQKFLPQFDGHCSFAVAKMSQKVPVNPETFRIDDGKLYLFYNDFWEGKPFNTIVPWLGDEATMEKAAKKNWQTLKDGK